MKAAEVLSKGEMPKYIENFAEPTIQNENEVLISVKASAVKNPDKMRASATQNEAFTAKVVGGDGVGILADGTRIYGIGVGGMIAEKAVLEKDRIVQLPQNIDEATAAALPNAVMGSPLWHCVSGLLCKAEKLFW